VPDVVLIVVGILIGIVIAYLLLRSAIQTRSRAEFERWKTEHEDELRRDTLARSRAALKGKVGEQLAPLLAEFIYAPADARFIGNPVDYVVFDGYTAVQAGEADELARIVFVEVKRGRSASLTRGERRVRDCVGAGRVEWAVVELPEPERDPASR